MICIYYGGSHNFVNSMVYGEHSLLAHRDIRCKLTLERGATPCPLEDRSQTQNCPGFRLFGIKTIPPEIGFIKPSYARYSSPSSYHHQSQPSCLVLLKDMNSIRENLTFLHYHYLITIIQFFEHQNPSIVNSFLLIFNTPH